MESGSGVKETGAGTGEAALARGPLGEGRGERGFTEERAMSTICSGESLLWEGSEDGKRELLGEEGRIRGEPEGLAGRPAGPPFCPPEKELKAKLSLPPGPPSPFPEDVELMEALLPCRLCRLEGSSTSVCGTRKIVRRLVRDRDGFMLTSL